MFLPFAISRRNYGLPHRAIMRTCSWNRCTGQFSRRTPLRDTCDIAEYPGELADRGEADDINYANLNVIPHKRLICKAGVPGKWRKLSSFGSKKGCGVTRNKSQATFQKGEWGNKISPIKDDFRTTFHITHVNLAAGLFWKENKFFGIREEGQQMWWNKANELKIIWQNNKAYVQANVWDTFQWRSLR